MPFVPTPNGIKVCVRGKVDGQQVCNIFHVKWPTSPNANDLDLVGTVFMHYWGTFMLPFLHNSYKQEAIEVYDISSAGQEGIIKPAPPTMGGQIGGSGTPNNVALAVKLLTGRTGRSQRGRFFLPAIPAGSLVTQNTVNATLRQAAQTFIEELITRLADEGAQLAVKSLVSGGVARAEGVLTPIIQAQANETLDSQRRRLPERGA